MGELKLKWVPHDLRDQVFDFVRRWSEETETPAARLVGWAGLARSKFFDWISRCGKANEHNGWMPRDQWLEGWEEKAMIAFPHQNPLERYRRLTFMMLDADIVAVSPSSVYRRVTPRNHSRKSSSRAPSSRFSNRALTGTRVSLRTHAPLTFPGVRSTAAH